MRVAINGFGRIGRSVFRILDKNKDIIAINQQHIGINWYKNHLDELKNIKKSWTATNV